MENSAVVQSCCSARREEWPALAALAQRLYHLKQALWEKMRPLGSRAGLSNEASRRRRLRKLKDEVGLLPFDGSKHHEHHFTRVVEALYNYAMPMLSFRSAQGTINSKQSFGS